MLLLLDIAVWDSINNALVNTFVQKALLYIGLFPLDKLPEKELLGQRCELY